MRALAVARRDEGEPAAVGRPGRLRVAALRRHQRARLAARDRDDLNLAPAPVRRRVVASQCVGDRAAVRAERGTADAGHGPEVGGGDRALLRGRGQGHGQREREQGSGATQSHHRKALVGRVSTLAAERRGPRLYARPGAEVLAAVRKEYRPAGIFSFPRARPRAWAAEYTARGDVCGTGPAIREAR